MNAAHSDSEIKDGQGEVCWYPPAPQRGVEVLPVGGVAQLRPLLLQELDLLPESVSVLFQKTLLDLVPREVCLVQLHYLYVDDTPGECVGVHHGEVVVSEVNLLQPRLRPHNTDNAL